MPRWRASSLRPCWRTPVAAALTADALERVLLNLENSALTHRLGVHDDSADAGVTMTRVTLDEISMQTLTFPEAFQAGRVLVLGRPAVLLDLFAMVERFGRAFSIVGPRPFPSA